MRTLMQFPKIFNHLHLTTVRRCQRLKVGSIWNWLDGATEVSIFFLDQHDRTLGSVSDFTKSFGSEWIKTEIQLATCKQEKLNSPTLNKRTGQSSMSTVDTHSLLKNNGSSIPLFPRQDRGIGEEEQRETISPNIWEQNLGNFGEFLPIFHQVSSFGKPTRKQRHG